MSDQASRFYLSGGSFFIRHIKFNRSREEALSKMKFVGSFCWKQRTCGLNVVILLTFLVLSGNSYAEEIKLDDALELFYKNNYDVLINRYETDKAAADLSGASLRLNPNLSINYTGVNIGSGGGVSDTGNTQLAVRVEQPIELGGKRALRTDAARESLEAARLSHKDFIRTQLIGFYSAYYNVTLDRLNAEFSRDELKRFQKTLEIAEKRYNAGFLTLNDLTKIKLALIDVENNITNLETKYKNDLEGFNVLLGTNNQLEPVNIQMQENFNKYAEESLMERAFNNRPDLLSLQKQLKSSESSLSLAKAYRIPDLSIGVEYDSFGTDYQPAIGTGISFNIPLFNRNQGEIARRVAESDQVKVQLERVKRQITADLREALRNYNGSLKILESYKNGKKDMEELLENSEKSFFLGGITALDLIDTQRTHKDFVTKYNQAFIQAVLNNELLKAYTGEQVPATGM